MYLLLMKNLSLIIVLASLLGLVACQPTTLNPEPSAQPVSTPFLSGTDSRAVAAFLNRIQGFSAARSSEAAQADSYNNLGVAQDLQGNYGQALAYHTQALDIRRTFADQTDLAKTYNNLAIVYARMGDADQASGFYTQAIALFHAQGKPQWEAHTLRNYAQLLETQGLYVTARQTYQAALAIWQTVGTQPMVNQLQADLSALPMPLGARSQNEEAVNSPATMDSNPGSKGEIRFEEDHSATMDSNPLGSGPIRFIEDEG